MVEILAGRPTVGLRTLDPATKVRILPSQPKFQEPKSKKPGAKMLRALPFLTKSCWLDGLRVDRLVHDFAIAHELITINRGRHPNPAASTVIPATHLAHNPNLKWTREGDVRGPRQTST